MKRRFFIFGLIGICLEVFFTGLCSMKNRNAKLTGSTSLWMFPIYGLAAFLDPVCCKLKKKPIVVRGAIYTICIFAVEYISGWILKKLGGCPWDYSKSKFNINGLIRLDYTPLWFMLGLFFERLSKSAFNKKHRLIKIK